MKVDQLRELALEFGIKDPESMRKPELKTELIARLISEVPDAEEKILSRPDEKAGGKDIGTEGYRSAGERKENGRIRRRKRCENDEPQRSYGKRNKYF